MSAILKNITPDTYNTSPLSKESSSEPIFGNYTDHIDSENEIVHILLDMEVGHLQQRYQHLLDQSPNQPKQIISNNQCSIHFLLKGIKLLSVTSKTKH